jgi:hypothetical protein
VGDLKPVVSVKELMKYMIDPSPTTSSTPSAPRHQAGRRRDRTEDRRGLGQDRVGAISLAEGAYLLKVRRPFTPPGDENNSTGPDAVELSPAQITAKVERDPVEWNARIEALRNVALEALDVAKRKTSPSWGRRRESRQRVRSLSPQLLVSGRRRRVLSEAPTPARPASRAVVARQDERTPQRP